MMTELEREEIETADQLPTVVVWVVVVVLTVVAFAWIVPYGLLTAG